MQCNFYKVIHFPEMSPYRRDFIAHSIWTDEDHQQVAKLMEKAERHGQHVTVCSGPPATSFADDASEFSLVTDLGGMSEAAKR